MERIDDDTARSQGVADHHREAEADDRCDQGHEQLEGSPQPHAKQTRPPFQLEVFVFGFDALALGPDQLGLLFEKFRCPGRDFRALGANLSGYRCRECLCTGLG